MEWISRGRVALVETIDGQAYTVGVHLATRGGVPVCVGVDVRAADLPESPGQGPEGAPALGWAEVNTRVLKRLPLPQLVEWAWRQHQQLARAGEAFARGERYYAEWQGPAPAAPRRGRRPLLDADGLIAVATAYLSTTRGRVAAVQAAMDSMGVLGGANGVTRDQANKAIKTARDAGLLPPSSRGKGTK